MKALSNEGFFFEYDGSSYRYGFNGKEFDPEGMGGGGSTYDYGFRIYNPQLGRFLSVDPLFKSFAWNSTYAYAENSPIANIDLDGLEKKEQISASDIHSESTKVVVDNTRTIVVHTDPNYKIKEVPESALWQFGKRADGWVKNLLPHEPAKTNSSNPGMKFNGKGMYRIGGGANDDPGIRGNTEGPEINLGALGELGIRTGGISIPKLPINDFDALKTTQKVKEVVGDGGEAVDAIMTPTEEATTIRQEEVTLLTFTGSPQGDDFAEYENGKPTYIRTGGKEVYKKDGPLNDAW